MSTSFSFFDASATSNLDDLRSRVRTLESLVARAPVPIAVAHDSKCKIITANAALAELLGVPADVNISLTPPKGEQPRYRIQRGGRDIPPEELPMQYAIAHRTGVSNDIEILRADGRKLYVQNDVEPLYDAHGEVCGCVSVCVDLTEHKRVEDVLRESDRRKDEFLAMLDLMGHDVRVAADGYQAAREIREALGSRVLLVAVTGWGQDEDQRRAREAGFDHHLTKPAEPSVLEDLVASVTGRRT